MVTCWLYIPTSQKGRSGANLPKLWGFQVAEPGRPNSRMHTPNFVLVRTYSSVTGPKAAQLKLYVRSFLLCPKSRATQLKTRAPAPLKAPLRPKALNTQSPQH